MSAGYGTSSVHLIPFYGIFSIFSTQYPVYRAVYLVENSSILIIVLLSFQNRASHVPQTERSGFYKRGKR